MEALEFIQLHADNAVAGKRAEVIADLTAEAMQQAGAAFAGSPNPLTGNSVKPAGQDGDAQLFDVTYSGENGASITLRDKVEQIGGAWKITGISRV